MSKCRTQTFRDKEGNRFLFPSLIIRENDEEARSGHDVVSEAMMISFGLGSDIILEKEWFEFDDEQFPHFVSNLNARCFFHGAATAYIFEGPLFEQVKEEICKF